MRIRVALLAILLASPLPAATPRESLVVSPSWLAEHLRDPNLVLLHVGDKAGYEAQHLPGARFVLMGDISVSDPNGLRLEMPAADDLRQRLQKLGISDHSRVVVYYGKDWVSPTTRVLFTLHYAGLGDRSSLLDGGMDAWIKAGHPVTAEVPEPREGKLAPLTIRRIIVDAAWLRENVGTPGVVLVDARMSIFYDGLESGGSFEKPHRAGHIAGAISIPFSEITDDSLVLRSPDELCALFESAGVKPGDTVVTYCHVGQQATAPLFAARTLGYRVLLYDGSYEEWSRLSDAPVENPAK